MIPPLDPYAGLSPESRDLADRFRNALRKRNRPQPTRTYADYAAEAEDMTHDQKEELLRRITR